MLYNRLFVTALLLTMGLLAAASAQEEAAGPLVAAAHPAKAWVDRAMAEAGKIEERENRAEGLGTIAGAAAEAGDRDTYHNAIQMAMAAAKETDMFTVGATMWSIAESQARAGDVDAAMATAQQAGDQTYVALAYAGAAKVLVKRGRLDDGKRLIAAADAVVGKLEDPYDQGWVTYLITEAKLAAGDVEGARQCIASCRDTISQAESLAAVAVWEGKSGQADAAARTIEQVRAAMAEAQRTVPAGELQLDFGQGKLAEALAHCRKIDDALATLQATVDPSPRTYALIEIARLSAQQGDANEARQYLAQAVAANESVEDAYERANNWVDIAHAKVDLGMEAELDTWIDGLGTPMERASASLGVANGLIEKNRRP